MAKMTTQVKIGDTFRFHYADGNPLWKVEKKSGANAWICKSQVEYVEIDGKRYESDYCGIVKAFTNAEIVRARSIENIFKQAHDESDNFYKSLKLGQVVHYNGGFDEYVRCEVVEKDGEKVLLPFELVGEWRQYDLPHRCADGSVNMGYHAKTIANKETFRPHASNVYECKPRGKNPTHMPAICLDLPPLSTEQEEVAKLVKFLNTLREKAEVEEVGVEALKEQIRNIKQFVEGF